MITIIIDLSEDLPVERRKAYIEEIEANFPFNYTDYELAHGFGDEPQIMIQLAQEEMTIEQEKYLNKFEYVREYNVRPGTMQPKTTLDLWQVEAINDILANQITKVPSNGKYTRFYTENLESEQWFCNHHLIDVHGEQPMYGALAITQFSTEGEPTMIRMSHNEVDDLLTALLQHRLDTARASHEAVAKLNDDSLSDLDERPF